MSKNLLFESSLNEQQEKEQLKNSLINSENQAKINLLVTEN